MAKYLRVLYDFTAEEEGEMSISVGDVVQFMNNVYWFYDYDLLFPLYCRKMMTRRMAGFMSTQQKMHNAAMYPQTTLKTFCLLQLLLYPLLRRLLPSLHHFLPQRAPRPPLTQLWRPLPAHLLVSLISHLCCSSLSKPLRQLLPTSPRFSRSPLLISTNSSPLQKVFKIWFASLILWRRREFLLSQLRSSAMISMS